MTICMKGDRSQATGSRLLWARYAGACRIRVTAEAMVTAECEFVVGTRASLSCFFSLVTLAQTTYGW